MRTRFFAAVLSLLAVSTGALAADRPAEQARFAPELRVAALAPAAVPAAAAARRTFDHPAIAARRVLSVPSVNPNTYLVQPPAHVDWLVEAAAR